MKKDLIKLILENDYDGKGEKISWEQNQLDKMATRNWKDAQNYGPAGIRSQHFDNIYAGYKNKNQVEPEETEEDREQKEKEAKVLDNLIPELEKKIGIVLSDQLDSDEKDYKHIKELLSEYIKLLKQIRRGALDVKFKTMEYNKIKDRERAELDYIISEIANEQLRNYVRDPSFLNLLNSLMDTHKTISQMSLFKTYNPQELSTDKQENYKEQIVSMLMGLNFKLHSNRLFSSETNSIINGYENSMSDEEIEEKILDSIQTININDLIECMNTQYKNLNTLRNEISGLEYNYYPGPKLWKYYSDLKKSLINIENMPILITESEGTLSLKIDPEREAKIRARWSQEERDSRNNNRNFRAFTSDKLSVQDKILKVYLDLYPDELDSSPLTNKQTDQASEFVYYYLRPGLLIKTITIAYHSFKDNVSDEIKEQFKDLKTLQERADNISEFTLFDMGDIGHLSYLMLTYLEQDLDEIKNINKTIELDKHTPKHIFKLL